MSKKLFSNLLILSLIVQASLGLFAFPHQAKATGNTYYVDNTVSDIHTGTCTPDSTTYDHTTFTTGSGSDSVFATIADINACNSTQLPPGSNVLFRKGQTWREQLTVPTSGSSGNPITYGAFGDGALAKPVISGADLVSTWTADIASFSETFNMDGYGCWGNYSTTETTAGRTYRTRFIQSTAGDQHGVQCRLGSIVV